MTILDQHFIKSKTVEGASAKQYFTLIEFDGHLVYMIKRLILFPEDHALSSNDIIVKKFKGKWLVSIPAFAIKIDTLLDALGKSGDAYAALNNEEE